MEDNSIVLSFPESPAIGYERDPDDFISEMVGEGSQTSLQEITPVATSELCLKQTREKLQELSIDQLLFELRDEVKSLSEIQLRSKFYLSEVRNFQFFSKH